MDWTALPLLALKLALLLAGLLVPGACVMRALRVPVTPATGFLGSTVLLYVAVLGLTLAGVRVSLLSLGLVLAAVSAGAAAWTRFTLLPSAPREETDSFSHLTWLGAWTPLAVAFWGIVAWRLGTQPLTGPDVGFRWSFLAEQLLATGSLDFYPPRRAADFLAYFWPESIPPGIAATYAWAYACGGGAQPLWTSPVVALQLLALHELIWRIAFSWGGLVAARRAVLLALATPLLTWAVLIGQETGQTALAACALLFGFLRWQKTKADRWAYFTALSAVAGAATREYGLVYPGLGFLLFHWIKAPDHVRLRYNLIAFPLALVWPLRTWWLTGNPFYSLNPGGWLPGNPVFGLWTEHFGSLYGAALAEPGGWWQIGRYFALMALPTLPACAGIAIYAARGLREARWAGLVALAFIALWLASVPFTAGGLFYSMRVLTPVFALGAAFGGYALVILGSQPRLKRLLVASLAGLLVATLPHTLTLPQNAYRLPAREWPAAGGAFTRSVADAEADLRTKLTALPHGGRILTESAGMTRALAPIGLQAVPPWSPEVAWLFDPTLPVDEIARRWNESKLGYLLLTKSAGGIDFVNKYARWQPPFFTLQKALETDSYLVFAISARAENPPPAPTAPQSGSAP